MAKRDRNTLKSYFKCGNMPQEEHFSDLIDSVLNLVDDQQPVVPTPPLPPSPDPPLSKEFRVEVPADGNWHSLTVPSDRCRCYSLVAGCSSAKEDRFALIYAVAMHCMGNARKIKYMTSWYLFFPSKLKLRWYSDDNAWTLQIRTRHNYGDGVSIYAKLTELWGETEMNWIL